jgi:hypothetical protein
MIFRPGKLFIPSLCQVKAHASSLSKGFPGKSTTAGFVARRYCLE